jgi:hypothetical protein
VLSLSFFFFLFSLTFNFRLSTPPIPALDLTMKNKKTNAEHLWKQVDDLVVPRLRLSVTERVVSR